MAHRSPHNRLQACSFCGQDDREHAPRRFIAGPDGVLICNQCMIRAAEILSERADGPDAPESVTIDAAAQHHVIADLEKKIQRLTDENAALTRELVAVRVNRRYPFFDAHTALTARAQLAQSLRDADTYVDAAAGFNTWIGEDEATAEGESATRERVSA